MYIAIAIFVSFLAGYVACALLTAGKIADIQTQINLERPRAQEGGGKGRSDSALHTRGK